MRTRNTVPNGVLPSTGKSTSWQKRRGQSVEGQPRKARNGLAILDRIIGDDPAVRCEMERERERLDIAQVIYDARTGAGLTQLQLARKAGTTQLAIARLEDADYRRHSLPLLKRVAQALGCRVRVALVPGELASKESFD